MAKAVAVRNRGDDYQARFFWIQACRLFEECTKVDRVAYEKDNIKSFDDVVAFYKQGMFDEDGNPIFADYYQVKFHVTAAGALTWKGMMDPAFINATSVSFLQRLKNAQQKYAPNGTGCRFILYGPWPIHPDDLLATIHSLTDGRIIWSKLATGGPRSALGGIREAWKEHLGIIFDGELEIILRPLRIRQGPTMAQLQETLNDKLRLAGLVPVEDGSLIHPYDELTRKLLQAGRNEFNSKDIELICKKEKLWRGYPIPATSNFHVGIRSFIRWAEYLEDETNAMLCLLKCFDGRKIKSPDLWQSQVLPEISLFLSKALHGHRQCLIHLHTHSSIAFATGYFLDSKAGIDAVPVQSTSSGKKVWYPSRERDGKDYPILSFAEEIVSNEESDIAIALSITRDVLDDVKVYVSNELPQVRRIVSCSIPPIPSDKTVLDGMHAKHLAQQLSSYLKSGRLNRERMGTIHFFIAAPNGLLFFIGQLARGFGPCVMYEYDFEMNVPGAYQLSFMFPLSGPTGTGKILSGINKEEL